MRVLLTSNASYLPPRGGSTRSNLTFLHALRESGHEVRVVAAAAERATPEQQDRLRNELKEQQLDGTRGNWDGIEIVSVPDFIRHLDVLAKQIDEFQPDWVLVSSEDVSHGLLREASRAAPGRLLYLAHTPQFFPFGPASWHADQEAAEIVRSAAGVVVISRAMAEYVNDHLGRQAVSIHPPLYGQGPYPVLSDYESGYIAMINPCAVKGISLFLCIADALPHERFAVLPGWGTTEQNLTAIRQRRNIAILPRVRDIEQFLKRVKVLLMPSLWLEGFGLIVMEAMLRGVPVIASDSGGLREAKTGTGNLIPVHLIEHYEPVFDERLMPKPVLSAQSIEPWVEAIRRLTESQEHYQREVQAEKQAAEAFTSKLDPFQIVKFLESLPPVERAPVRKTETDLSAARRRLLLKRLRESPAKP